jgi:hypothetical protein
MEESIRFKFLDESSSPGYKPLKIVGDLDNELTPDKPDPLARRYGRSPPAPMNLNPEFNAVSDDPTSLAH